MLYRTVPKTGDKLSILGFGCMRLPAKDGGDIDEERADQTDPARNRLWNKLC